MLLVGGSCFWVYKKKEKRERFKKFWHHTVLITLPKKKNPGVYPDASSSKEIRSGPGNDSGLPVEVDWNARVMECHDPSIGKRLCRRTPSTCTEKPKTLHL